MLIREIMTSCSNDRVAQAALASIGGPFAARIEARADDLGLAPGQFAAKAVRRFSTHAHARDIEGLRQAMVGHDQPVLAGLRHILEMVLHRQDSEADYTEFEASKATPGLSACRVPNTGAPCHVAL